ncbi:MAG: hypothetical protein RLZZ344_707 [Pseudomonadota bacterium]
MPVVVLRPWILVFLLVLVAHAVLAFLVLQNRSNTAVDAPEIVAFFVAPQVRSVARQAETSPAPDKAPPASAQSVAVPRPVVSHPHPLPSPAVIAPDPSPTALAETLPVSSPPMPAATSESVRASAATSSAPSAPAEVSYQDLEVLIPAPRVYPRQSVYLGETGKVVVRVVIDDQGIPSEVTLAEPSRYPRLNEAALRSARQARFKPYRINSKPISVTIPRWVFTYNLKDSE